MPKETRQNIPSCCWTSKEVTTFIVQILQIWSSFKSVSDPSRWVQYVDSKRYHLCYETIQVKKLW